ncbi:MAG: hypothetical protein F4Z07_13420 [Dehalococcoidia bacterium]|nr:hypothetical protein [Dehalococcoidia bacterium]
MSDDYLPLSEREKPEADRVGLADGVPPWLRSSIAAWVDVPLEAAYKRSSQHLGDLVREIERNARVSPGLNFSGSFPEYGARTDLRNRILNGTEETTLNVVDYLVRVIYPNARNKMEAILQEGGSAWGVGIRGDGKYGLVKRVPAALQDLANQATGGAQQHHKYLRKAWGEAYGREPSPDTAYKDAVRAVEAVSIPIVTPSQSRATLGSVIAELRDNGEDYATRLSPSAEPDSVTVVREMLQLLWKSQWDRHGVEDDIPLTVSQKEAEDALSLAVTLVRWFDTGAIYRK